MSKNGNFLRLGFLLASILTLSVIFQSGVLGQSSAYDFLGFSGYITSQTELNNAIAIMESQNLTVYRVSFRPSWQIQDGSIKSYNTEFIDYLLSNTNFFVIVDGNHLYPPTEASAQDARNHWTAVRDRNFQTLEHYPNNTRVAVELINEYASSDYDIRIQALIDEIRNAGYTNPIVTNKLNTEWLKFSDPFNNTFQGAHFYFNTWSPASAMTQMKIASSIGIKKILNTEVGASYKEYKYYTQANVDALESFLSQSHALGIGNCLWMNNDAVNWQGYTQYGFDFNTPTSTPSPFPEPLSIPTPKPSPTPKPTATPTPTSTSSPTPTLFVDSFESQKFNMWSGKGGAGSHSETIDTRNPQQGNYNAKFVADSKSESWAYKNLPASPVLYFQQFIKLDSLPTSGNRLFLGTIQSNSRNSMEVYIENNQGRYYWGLCTSIDGNQYYDRETNASNPQIGTYFAIEMCRDLIDYKSKLWVDGTLKIDVDCSHVGYADRVYSGITWTNTRAVVYVDNIKVSSIYIGVDTLDFNQTQIKPENTESSPYIYSGTLMIFILISLIFMTQKKFSKNGLHKNP